MSEPKLLELEKEIKKSRSYMTRYLNGNASYSHRGDNIYLQEPVNLQNTINNSNGYLSSENNGAIKINSGVKHINVKATLAITHNIYDDSTAYLYIRKNGTIVAQLQGNIHGKTVTESMTCFINYLEVAEGDLIQLYIACDNEEGFIIGNSGFPITQLSVEIVD